MSLPSYVLEGFAAFLLALCYLTFRAVRARSHLSDIRGPPPSSFWIGNEEEIRYQNEVGEIEFKWLRKYGNVWRTSACMGEQALVVADPKALQHILHTSGYRYPKRADVREVTRILFGTGIVWADGMDVRFGSMHQRHRKIMNPAFSEVQLKSFLPVFEGYANKVVCKWRADLGLEEKPDGMLINVIPWFSRMALDIIGITGFNYEFGALDDAENELTAVYKDLLWVVLSARIPLAKSVRSVDSTLYPSKPDLVFKSFWHLIPDELLHLVRFLPGREYRRFRQFNVYMRKFARRIVAESEAQGDDGKDIISVLLRANASMNPKSKLSDSEVYDQISTLLLAGHETSSGAIGWLFYELAQDPIWQAKIRDEIAVARERLASRGETDFSVADLEGMTAMQAAIKESLRLHPIVWQFMRVAAQDDVLPLALAITTNSGKTISDIPIPKGQNIIISVCSYNRLPEIWGEDADRWNPERFMHMDKKKQIPLGVYSNLMNFSGGVRACIGWRFTIIEAQVVTAALLEHFEFSLPKDQARIFRKPTGLMTAMSDDHVGAWMGLHVKMVK
ncbi:hypothetical protein EWM64_g4475 [Hericium alpestre]|uniref:Cytochrome P450 n=1 Tax=Hericium alpestre TaxID=135208 RepID=A0A4Y9ZXE6_9AGAM|nr:hypothetical protein EWM64_g4475 [Hericium alpestre]